MKDATSNSGKRGPCDRNVGVYRGDGEENRTMATDDEEREKERDGENWA